MGKHTGGACANRLDTSNLQRSAGHIVAPGAVDGVVSPDVETAEDRVGAISLEELAGAVVAHVFVHTYVQRPAMQFVPPDFRGVVEVPYIHCPGNAMNPAVLNERSGAFLGDLYIADGQVPAVERVGAARTGGVSQIEGRSARDMVRSAGLIEDTRSVVPDVLGFYDQRPFAEVVGSLAAGLVTEVQYILHLVRTVALGEHACVLVSDVFVRCRQLRRGTAEVVRSSPDRPGIPSKIQVGAHGVRPACMSE